MAATAFNEHIGSMAALPPLENVCGIECLSPATEQTLKKMTINYSKN
jgi:hypothetical protein